MSGRFARWVIEGVTMFIVAAASLLLLLYVGFGDGKRTYELMQLEKLTAQGLFLQNSIEKFLRDGLPLKQYAGFSTLAAPVLESDDDVDALIVYDQAGNAVFTAIDKKRPALPEPPPTVKNVGEAVQVHHGVTHYQVVLPLRSKFETVGSVVVVSPTTTVNKRMRDSFTVVAVVSTRPFAQLGLQVRMREMPRARATLVPQRLQRRSVISRSRNESFCGLILSLCVSGSIA